MESFSEVLRRLRERLGYPSSRKFYNGNGGRKFFQCTYRQFLNVEAGSSMPGPALVTKIAIGLGLSTRPEAAREFTLAYLRALIGNEDLLKLVVSSLSSGVGEFGDGSLVRSFARINEERGLNLTREQTKVLCSSFENYWAFTLLANDKAAWRPAELAEAIGVREVEARRSLERLVAAELLEKNAKGEYRCPTPGRVFRLPDDKIYTLGFEALRGYKDKMAAKKGSVLFRYHFSSRGSEAQVRQYLPYLAQALQGAEVCSTHEKGSDTVLFDMETVVRKVLPF